ncbi:MAG TPA: UDP-N-acetylglucosamine 2-epimerase (non-hydrolyzing) [Gammaproteobacteria bacterium]|nr:UDP-N-acetylglucosamine 2-epimerase (non-hydrolyzing) [Gammaproteobacteria bacterium]
MKIACVFGTRPEIIKFAPIIAALKKQPEFELTLIATDQHRELLQEMLKVFDIHPDIELHCMLPNQSLTSLTTELLRKVAPIFTEKKYDAVLIQGDTTTVMVVALVCFYNHIPVGHIEAGLRTFDIHNPFPEEMNRIFVSPLSSWHFVPTEIEYNNLVREHINENKIFITGNTVIDAIKMIIQKGITPSFKPQPDKRTILVTAHRRENHGAPLKNICQALKILTKKFDDIQIVFPVHPNPNVHETVHKILGDEANIHLIAPLTYTDFVAYMNLCYFIMSDSGGVQEEAPALGKPVLILRDNTERPKTVSCGAGLLVGTSVENIVVQASTLLTDSDLYYQMSHTLSPYGDGKAAERIVEILKTKLFNLEMHENSSSLNS